MVEVQFFRHAFFKIKSGNKSILIDPVLEFRAPNKDFDCLVDCTFREKDFRDVSAILITHEHFDHFDKQAVEKIALENHACIIAPHHILEEMNGKIPKAFLHPISMGQKISIRGIEVEGIAAHHPQSFYPLGFLIKFGDTTIYHAGDTELISDMEKLSPDIALLPIGGHETMDCVDAVRAVKIMKPKLAIPMHYNTFKMIQQDPREFKQKIEKSILKTKVVVLNPGKKVKF